MKVAVALLLEVPDGVHISSNKFQWQKVLNGGNDLMIHPIFGDLSMHVNEVQVHSDPDVIFGDDSEVWLIQERNPSGLLSDRGYWHNDVEGFTGWGDVRTATRFSDHDRATLSLPFDGVWVVDAPK